MRGISLLCASAMVVALSAAAAADDKADCAGKDADLAIRGCTAIIKTGGQAANALAVIYTNRGAAHASKKDYDQAIADFTKAIEINPKYAKAYDHRGVAYTSKGDYPRAIADVTKAVELSPKKVSPPAAAKPAPPKTAAKTPPSAKSPPKSAGAKAAAPQMEKENGNDEPRWAVELRKIQPN